MKQNLFSGFFILFVLPCFSRLLYTFNNFEKLLGNSTNSLSGVEAFETLKAGTGMEHNQPTTCLYPAFRPCCGLLLAHKEDF